MYNNLAANLLNLREFAAAEQWITEGVEYCAERDLDPWRLSLRSLLADIRLARGDWKGADELADELVGNARTPPFVRVSARPRAAAVSRRLRTMGARGVARGPQNATRTNPAKLTKREIEVLTLIADGLRNAEIAGRLFISVKTVDHHVSAILGKLGARSRGHAARALPGLLGTADGP